MKTFDILKPVLLLCALITGNATLWAEKTYKLTPVTSVEAGGLYVFELTYTEKYGENIGSVDNYVMNNTVNSDGLQTTTSYKKSGLTGTESYVWTLEAKDGGFYMKNVNSNKYLNNTKSGDANVSFGSKSSVWAFNFQTTDNFLIQNTSNENRFLGMNLYHRYKAYATSSMDNYQHDIKVYKLEEEPPVPIAIGSAGIATFCSDKALDFTGVNAIAVYKAKVEDDVVKLHQIHKVPANTGVILMNALGRENGAVASVNVPVLTGSADDVSDNELVGVTTRTLVKWTEDNDKFNYILQSDGESGIVFNIATTEGAYMPAGKAYLSTGYESPAPGGGGARLSVVFADAAQGISATLNNKEIMNNVVYDLQGRPIANSRLPKGLYIVNGKKTVVK